MASISLQQVIKRYGNGPKANQVVHGIDAEIADGEFIVIVGPSGCGKSTLLRMVAGLEEVSGGTIAIGGKVVNDIEPSDRDIAMVFQNYALYPHMSVYENMAYGLKIAKVPADEIRQRVDKAAAILEIGAFLQRKPRELSGGQRQRVAMGRAIVRQPQVFLFDEPLSNLDAKLRAQTRLEIKKLHAELGVTSLFVTHDQVEAMTLGERLIVLNAGRMEQFGTPEEVYARPASAFVASFMGSPPMNLLEGRIEGAHLQVGPVALPLGIAAPISAGDAILGIRPEHLQIVVPDAETRPADSAHDGAEHLHWPMQVEVIEMLGAERLIYGRVGSANHGHKSNAANARPPLLTVRMDAELPAPRPGDTVTLRAPIAHLHWFDARTSQRQRLAGT